MSKDGFEQRKNALEETFFAKHNAELLQRLRKKAAIEASKKSLMATAGIHDESVLNELIRLDISGETVVALSLVPLIQVAWADGVIDKKERDAVIAAAENKGVAKDGPAHELLENWLREKPSADLWELWKNYVRALVADLDQAARVKLKDDLLDRARVVAEAADGFLGLVSKVSKAERRVLEELEQTFG